MNREIVTFVAETRRSQRTTYTADALWRHLPSGGKLRWAIVPLFAAVAFALGGTAVQAEEDGFAELREAGRLSTAVEQRLWPWQSDTDGWEDVPATSLELHPQQTVEPGLERDEPLTVTLRARVDGDRLLLHLAWPDAGEDTYSTEHTDRFADALAVQFAPGKDDALPYIGMGEPERPVAIWFWRAGRGTEALAGRGFGTLEPHKDADPPEATVRRTADGWSVVMAGPRPGAVNPLPLSVAVWNGAEDGRDGRKRLSAWHLLRLPGHDVDGDRVEALSAAARAAGNTARGERLVRERGCTACHRLPDAEAPDTLVGPDLTLAGALHWPGYLRRAIARPSAFIVPRADYMADKGVSKMPDLRLPRDDVADIVAYLHSLR